ncbi:fasciclin domain-containing protein [Rathayibacter rathayi]|uniref:Fasciclin domain-containing protein n=1 Tax=Rathayibacter rathayi TaxID=33887 RepID=A0ABD6WBF7_RATRA|nr:fasciclin domain-containing protein [Rathayibacter rathayi]AZZ47924.1 fasciclin domain-containing protein [Rathayibacter rathayi]MWV74816.1 fasciclin domain-containing protein [Rathayibacter rathayi NCPPB 2980 = VKM Ac-1601]PPF15572.1 fasciclin domain-containing protein [Rathayibacter rathayi]PPF26010.1 fasciclin domain-containing protein [Rathayibacter rathayi]PPF51287.1 fasciclin domain-containing protein [Rathayibacter rathayi]
MRSTKRSALAAFALLGTAALGLTACSSGSGSTTTSSDAGTEMSTPMASPTSASSTPKATMDPTANLVGAGCAAYAAQVPDGAGSVEGMSLDPVATAASNNPLLTTLTAAVSGGLNPDVNLVDTLNSGEFTVFAPVDDAFAKLDAATVDTLKTPEGAATLSSILTYHVVPGQIAPDAIVGDHATVQGGKVTVTGSGDNLKVNDASVICGGVQTANATVYLIDTVLTPPAS